MPNQQNAFVINYNKKNLSIFSLLTFVLYLFSTLLLAKLHNTSLQEVIFFNPNAGNVPAIAIILRWIASVSAGVLLILIGLIWTMASKSEFEDYLQLLSFIIIRSVLILIGTTSIFKILTSSSIDRLNFLLIIFICLCGGLLSLYHTKAKLLRIYHGIKKTRALITLTIGLVIAASVYFPFHGKYLKEDKTDDSFEVYTMARSLKTHILASRNFEYGLNQKEDTYGIVGSQPYFIDSYIDMFSLVLLGDSDTTIRLYYPIYIFLIFLIINAFLPPASISAKNSMILSIGLQLFLYTTISFFYVGHDPYFVDICVDPMRESLLMIFILLEIYFLINKNNSLFQTFAIFSTLVLASGPIFTVIILASYWLTYREAAERIFLKKAVITHLFYFGILIIVYVVIGVTQGYLHYWLSEIKAEYVDEYFRPNSFKDVTQFLKYFVIYSGGFSILGFLLLKSKDKVSVLLSYVTLGYLSVVLGGGYKNVHYLAPITLFPTIIFFRRIAQAGNQRLIKGSLLCALSIIFLIIITFPRNYQVHTNYRDHGHKTCCLFNSSEECWETVEIVMEGSTKMERVENVELWLEYADITKNPTKKYNFYFTNKNTPPGQNFKLFASFVNSYFWTNLDDNAIIQKAPKKKEYLSDLFTNL